MNNIQSDINNNIPLPTMNAGVMYMYHSDPDTYIDDTE